MFFGNLEYLFCDYVLELQDILKSDNINYDRICDLINENYKSDDTDIEDLGDMIELINNHIFKNIESGKGMEYIFEKNNKLMGLRMIAKKCLNKKFREGMAYLFSDK